LHLCISSRYLDRYNMAMHYAQELISNIYEDYKRHCDKHCRAPIPNLKIKKNESMSGRRVNQNQRNSNPGGQSTSGKVPSSSGYPNQQMYGGGERYQYNAGFMHQDTAQRPMQQQYNGMGGMGMGSMCMSTMGSMGGLDSHMQARHFSQQQQQQPAAFSRHHQQMQLQQQQQQPPQPQTQAQTQPGMYMHQEQQTKDHHYEQNRSEQKITRVYSHGNHFINLLF
jgi:hypothetical protein